jgi:hypothetical protein
MILPLDRDRTVRRAPAIVTLKDLAAELDAPNRSLRTVVVERGIAFNIVGVTWVFTAKGADQVRAAWKDHLRKAAALGIKPRAKAAESAIA